MSRFKLLAESDSSSMMINDDGVFVLPASTPGFLIVDFITKGLKEADRRMSEWASMEKEEAFLISSCINELGLIQLDKVGHQPFCDILMMLKCLRMTTFPSITWCIAAPASSGQYYMEHFRFSPVHNYIKLCTVYGFYWSLTLL